jgi:hypothetical protein
MRLKISKIKPRSCTVAFAGFHKAKAMSVLAQANFDQAKQRLGTWRSSCSDAMAGGRPVEDPEGRPAAHLSVP